MPLPADLVTTRRTRAGLHSIRVGTVRYDASSSARVPPGAPAAGAGHHDAGDHDVLGFTVAIEPASPSDLLVACFIRIRLDDPRCRVVEAWTGGDAVPGGLVDDDPRRTPETDHPAEVTVSGTGGGVVGWFFGAVDGTGDLPRSSTVHAQVSSPPAVTDLSGVIRAEVTLRRRGFAVFAAARGRRVRHARDLHPRGFALPRSARPAGDPLPVRGSASEQDTTAAATRPRGAVRLCMVADVEKFSRFRNPEAVRAQRRLVQLLSAARRQAGVADDLVDPQDSGDGQFVVMPAGIDESETIPRLIDGLLAALRRTNADLGEHARLRLRVALHRGHVERASNGWVGDATIAVHRLVDSVGLRRALRDNPDTDVALLVADAVYRDVILHGYGRLRPEEFHRIVVRDDAKDFTDTAWLFVPKA
jgi:hypothetical protein